MAAVVDAARAAREEAFRLRCDARELRHAMHTSGELARVKTRRAAAAAATTRSLRMSAAPSPWSGLAWLRDDEALHTVLVPLD